MNTSFVTQNMAMMKIIKVEYKAHSASGNLSFFPIWNPHNPNLELKMLDIAKNMDLVRLQVTEIEEKIWPSRILCLWTFNQYHTWH